MSFFEKAESQTVSPRERERRPVLPPWYGPAPGSLPGQSTQQVVAFKTSEAVLRLRHFDFYPAGFLFSLSLHLREPSDGQFDMPWELSDRQPRMPDGSLPDSFLRIGFELEDGSTWTNFNTDPGPSRNETPSGPLVLGRRGGGGDDEWEMDYWFWPLPDDGDIVVHASWPQYGIEEVSAVIDGVSLRTAATESEHPGNKPSCEADPRITATHNLPLGRLTGDSGPSDPPHIFACKYVAPPDTYCSGSCHSPRMPLGSAA